MERLCAIHTLPSLFTRIIRLRFPKGNENSARSPWRNVGIGDIACSLRLKRTSLYDPADNQTLRTQSSSQEAQ